MLSSTGMLRVKGTFLNLQNYWTKNRIMKKLCGDNYKHSCKENSPNEQ
jgi:hypothetical protein